MTTTDTHYPVTKAEARNLLVKTYNSPKPFNETDSKHSHELMVTAISLLPLQELFWLYDKLETQLFTEPTGQPYDVDIPNQSSKYANMGMINALLEIMVQRLEVDYEDMQAIILNFFRTYHPDKIKGTEADDSPNVDINNEDNVENALNDFKVNNYLPDMNDIEYKLDKLQEQVNTLLRGNNNG